MIDLTEVARATLLLYAEVPRENIGELCDVSEDEIAVIADVSDRWRTDASLNGAGPQPTGDDGDGLRTRGVIWERVRPVRWLWQKRIPCGLLSLIVGEEDVGKGTLMSWLVARATRGELDGDLAGEPINVLIVGDEDGFEPIWVPRLSAAGADLEHLRTLGDDEYLDDLQGRADDLAVAVERDEIGLIIFDQVLDHIDGGQNGQAVYNPKAVRQALLPLRRVAGKHGIAAVGLLHPIKGRAKSFRELMAGSHQFNAVSRSSLLLGKAPEDEGRRVLVRGKGNHSAAPRSFEFRIGVSSLVLTGNKFEMPIVEDPEEGDRTVEDLLAVKAPVTDALMEKLFDLLTDKPQFRASLARAVGRDPKDGSVGNALQKLKDEGRAKKLEEPGKRGWVRCK